MKRCERCNKWMHEGDSSVCDPCWEDMGQMSFFQDEDESWDPYADPNIDVILTVTEEDPRISAAEERRIDTIFDRDLNRDMYR